MTNAMESKADYGNAFQGWILVSAAWLSTMANQVVAPILPKMTQYFSDQPSVLSDSGNKLPSVRSLE